MNLNLSLTLLDVKLVSIDFGLGLDFWTRDLDTWLDIRREDHDAHDDV